MSKRNWGIAAFLLGLVLVCAGAGLLGGHAWRSWQAGENTRTLLDQLLTDIDRREYGVQTQAAQQEHTAGEMPRTAVGGHELVGVLQIPALGLELPILNDWSYALLKAAPCRYSGSVEGNDLILLGHNFKEHFGPLRSLLPGGTILFRDVNANTYAYRVTQTQVLQPTQLDILTSPGHDLTLFTCTYGGRSRFVVRCERLEE